MHLSQMRRKTVRSVDQIDIGTSRPMIVITFDDESYCQFLADPEGNDGAAAFYQVGDRQSPAEDPCRGCRHDGSGDQECMVCAGGSHRE